VTVAQILTRDDNLIESLFVSEKRKAWECVTLIDSLDVDTPTSSHVLTSSGNELHLYTLKTCIYIKRVDERHAFPGLSFF
jgi:hypothetical protein